MRRLARVLITAWPRLVVLVGLLGAASVWASLRLEFDFSFSHMFLASREDAVAAEMSGRFGDAAGSYLVAVIQGPDVLATRRWPPSAR